MIHLLSQHVLADIQTPEDVVSSAPGQVPGVRDGLAPRLAETVSDQADWLSAREAAVEAVLLSYRTQYRIWMKMDPYMPSRSTGGVGGLSSWAWPCHVCSQHSRTGGHVQSPTVALCS